MLEIPQRPRSSAASARNWESINELLITLGFPPKGSELLSLILIFCSQHGIQLEYDLFYFSISLPVHDQFCSDEAR